MRNIGLSGKRLGHELGLLGVTFRVWMKTCARTIFAMFNQVALSLRMGFLKFVLEGWWHHMGNIKDKQHHLGVIRDGPMEWEIIEAWAKVAECQHLCRAWQREAQKQAFQQREVLQDVDEFALAHEIRRGM